MKTNHRRGFIAKRFHNGQQSGGYVTFAGNRPTLDGKMINASSTLSSENSRSVARDRRGAKKFCNSRGRFHDRMGLQKIIQNLEFET